MYIFADEYDDDDDDNDDFRCSKFINLEVWWHYTDITYLKFHHINSIINENMIRLNTAGSFAYMYHKEKKIVAKKHLSSFSLSLSIKSPCIRWRCVVIIAYKDEGDSLLLTPLYIFLFLLFFKVHVRIIKENAVHCTFQTE